MNEFQFKPEVAELYGVNEAIFLHSLSFWIMKNWSNGTNYHDGHYWSYDTYKAIAARFPFWSVRQVERIVANCEEKGAILVGNYNADKTDRTKWYTLAGGAAAIYVPKTVDCISPNGELTEPHGDEPNPPNGKMQFTEEGQPITQTVKCNKVTVTYPDKDTPRNPPAGGATSDELFKRFWQAYPRKANKAKAKKAWDKLNPDLTLCRTMATALHGFIGSPEWTRDAGAFIPHPATWLNNRRWEDEGVRRPPSGGRVVETEEVAEW